MAPSLAHPVSYGQVIEYIQGMKQNKDTSEIESPTDLSVGPMLTLLNQTVSTLHPTLMLQTKTLLSHILRRPSDRLTRSRPEHSWGPHP
jgi:hypothetical protein